MPVYVAGCVISNEAAAALAVGASYSSVPGTSAVYTLTIGGAPTAGAASSFRLSFDGYTTAPILWSATNATLVTNVDAALEALSSVGTGGVTTAVGTMTAGVGTLTITAAGGLAGRVLPAMAVVANSLTGAAPTVAVTTTTPGVDATVEAAAGGSLPGTNTTAGDNAIACGTGTLAGADSLASGSGSVAAGLQSSASGLGVIASCDQCHAEGRGTLAGVAPRACAIDGVTVTISGSDATADFYATGPVGLTSLSGGTGPTAALATLAADGVAFADPDTILTLTAPATTHTAGEINSTDFVSASHAEGAETAATGHISHAEGQFCAASGATSHAQGDSTTASGICSHAEGQSTVASGGYAHAQGEATTASGVHAHAEGQSSVASGDASHAQGRASRASLIGQFAVASGMFTDPGDAQASLVVARASTVDATPTPLLVGAADAIAIRAGTTCRFAVDVVARKSGDGTVGGGFGRSGLFANDTGTTALIGSVATVGTDVNASALAVAVTADDANDALVITVTGLAATPIRWVAAVHLVEVG